MISRPTVAPMAMAARFPPGLGVGGYGDDDEHEQEGEDDLDTESLRRFQARHVCTLACDAAEQEEEGGAGEDSSGELGDYVGGGPGARGSGHRRQIRR